MSLSLKKIIEQLKRNDKYLTELTLVFMTEDINHGIYWCEEESQFLNALQFNTTIRDLELSYCEGSTLSKQSFRNLMNTIGANGSFKRIKINIGKFILSDTDNMNALSDALSKCKTCRSLSISFDFYSDNPPEDNEYLTLLSNKNFILLSKTISNLTPLEFLSLKFSSPQKLDPKDFELFFNNIKTVMTMNLTLNGLLSAAQLESILKSLTQANIGSLRLRLSQISEWSLSHFKFFSLYFSLIKVQHLELSGNDLYRISAESCQVFIGGLKSSKTLNHINFAQTKLLRNIVQSFGENYDMLIQRRITSELYLSFIIHFIENAAPTSLNLFDTDLQCLSNESMTRLFLALSRNKSICKLISPAEFLERGEEVCSAFCEMIKNNHSLTSLELSGLNISKVNLLEIERFSNAISVSRLQELALLCCSLGLGGHRFKHLQILLDGINQSNIVVLNISTNQLGRVPKDNCIPLLAKFINTNTKIHTLYCNSNELLMDHIHNSSLLTNAIARNKRLKKLEINDGTFGVDRNLKLVYSALVKSSITELSICMLGCNPQWEIDFNQILNRNIHSYMLAAAHSLLQSNASSSALSLNTCRHTLSFLFKPSAKIDRLIHQVCAEVKENQDISSKNKKLKDVKPKRKQHGVRSK